MGLWYDKNNKKDTPIRTRYQIKDGEWIYPVTKGYEFECCHCSLVHKIDFDNVQRDFRFRLQQNMPLTQAAKIQRYSLG